MGTEYDYERECNEIDEKMTTKEQQLTDEIKQFRENRKQELIRGFPDCSNEMIEKFLNEERHDSEYVWGKPRTDLLEAELKGRIEARKELIKEELKLLNNMLEQYDNKHFSEVRWLIKDRIKQLSQLGDK